MHTVSQCFTKGKMKVIRATIVVEVPYKNELMNYGNKLDKEIIVSNDMPDLVESNERKSSNGYNPISDNEGMLSRIFRGKGDRY